MATQYTDRDVRRAAKQVAAACQATFDAHNNLAKCLGELRGILDEIDNAKPGMSLRSSKIDALIGDLSAAYNAIVDELRR